MMAMTMAQMVEWPKPKKMKKTTSSKCGNFFILKFLCFDFFQIWRRRLRLMQKLAYSVEYHLFIIFIWIFFLLFFVPRDDDLIEAVEMDMDDNANDVDRDQKIIGQRATYALTPTLAGRLWEDHLP